MAFWDDDDLEEEPRVRLGSDGHVVQSDPKPDPYAQNPNRRYIYIDESGDLVFTAKGSRYFFITSVMLKDYVPCHHLYQLRRDIHWDGFDPVQHFHARENPKPVRDRVFDAIAIHDIRVDVTIFEKRKAFEMFHEPPGFAFYKMASYYHLKHLLPLIGDPQREVMLIAAKIEMAGKQEELANALNGVVAQFSEHHKIGRSSFLPSKTEMGLQIADYCSWAVFQKWELGKTDSYDKVKHLYVSEFDIFRGGRKFYY